MGNAKSVSFNVEDNAERQAFITFKEVNNATGVFGNFQVFTFIIRYRRFVWEVNLRFSDVCGIDKVMMSNHPQEMTRIMRPSKYNKLLWNHDRKFLEERARMMTKYLQDVLDSEILFENQRFRRVVDITSISFNPELGAKGKEGYLKKCSGGYVEKFSRKAGDYFSMWVWRWVALHDTCISWCKGPSQDVSRGNLQIDQGFQVLVSGRVITILTLTRKLLFQAETARSAAAWAAAMREMYKNKPRTSPQYFDAIYPPRMGCDVKVYTYTKDYMGALAIALLGAQKEILITSWKNSPTVLISRPPFPPLRLDQVLQYKAQQGVEVYVLLYKEVENIGQGNDSMRSKSYLEGLHRNIHVIRHPNKFIGGSTAVLWSHHEKSVTIDRNLSFVGGVDLAFQRWDNEEHRCADEEGLIYPGADYRNPAPGLFKPLRCETDLEGERDEEEEVIEVEVAVPGENLPYAATTAAGAMGNDDEPYEVEVVVDFGMAESSNSNGLSDPHAPLEGNCTIPVVAVAGALSSNSGSINNSTGANLKCATDGTSSNNTNSPNSSKAARNRSSIAPNLPNIVEDDEQHTTTATTAAPVKPPRPGKADTASTTSGTATLPLSDDSSASSNNTNCSKGRHTSCASSATNSSKTGSSRYEEQEGDYPPDFDVLGDLGAAVDYDGDQKEPNRSSSGLYHDASVECDVHHENDTEDRFAPETEEERQAKMAVMQDRDDSELSSQSTESTSSMSSTGFNAIKSSFNSSMDFIAEKVKAAREQYNTKVTTKSSSSLEPRDLYPRMGWHDLQCCVTGMVARDVSSHFIQRWNHHRLSTSDYNAPVMRDITDDPNYGICARCKQTGIHETVDVCHTCGYDLGPVNSFSVKTDPEMCPSSPLNYSFMVFECKYPGMTKIPLRMMGDCPVVVTAILQSHISHALSLGVEDEHQLSGFMKDLQGEKGEWLHDFGLLPVVGDVVLEVDGATVSHLNSHQFNRLLRKKRAAARKLVNSVGGLDAMVEMGLPVPTVSITFRRHYLETLYDAQKKYVLSNNGTIVSMDELEAANAKQDSGGDCQVEEEESEKSPAPSALYACNSPTAGEESKESEKENTMGVIPAGNRLLSPDEVAALEANASSNGATSNVPCGLADNDAMPANGVEESPINKVSTNDITAMETVKQSSAPSLDSLLIGPGQAQPPSTESERVTLHRTPPPVGNTMVVSNSTNDSVAAAAPAPVSSSIDSTSAVNNDIAAMASAKRSSLGIGATTSGAIGRNLGNSNAVAEIEALPMDPSVKLSTGKVAHARAANGADDDEEDSNNNSNSLRGAGSSGNLGPDSTVQRRNSAKVRQFHPSCRAAAQQELKLSMTLLFHNHSRCFDVPQRLSDGSGSCKVQLLRSIGKWSTGTKTECSIMNCYIETIRDANHFIYIENQFFVGNMAGKDVVNGVPAAIADRIVLAFANKQKFRVIIIIPVHPNGDFSSALKAKVVMHYEYYTINRGVGSMFAKIRQACPGININEYIGFYSLRNWGVINNKVVSDQVYVHDKLLIVDDRVLIIGSANINDRSMLGNRDSELAVRIEDTLHIPSTMAQAPFTVGFLPHMLRVKLMRQHLGESDSLDVADPFDPNVFAMWKGRANTNSAVYDSIDGNTSVYRCTTVQDWKNAFIHYRNPSYLDPEVQSRMAEIKGCLVDWPQTLFSHEDLSPSLATRTIIPNELWV